MAAEAVVFCDGCSEPNPGTEGMGAVILVGAERIELYNGGGQGTNNSAELGAALLALEALPPQCRVTVYSDSQYAIFGMTKWLDGWRRKGFVRGGEAIPNAALWRCLDEINSGRSIRWEWVRGHNGNRGNELADELATLGRQSGLCRSLGARWMA
jgi:ribonuclease HI